MSSLYISQEDLIDQIAANTDTYKNSVRIIIKSLEDVIYSNLKKASPECQHVEVKLMNGFTLKSEYVPDRERVDPRTGSPVTVKAGKLIKSHLSTRFKEKLNR